MNAWNTLVWLEACYGPSGLKINDQLVLGQKGSPTDTVRELAKAAPMATGEMLAQMETYLADTKNPPVLRAFAGLSCLLGHGCLRLSDAQRSENLSIAVDATLGVSWRSKRARKNGPWAALGGASGLPSLCP